MNDQEDAAREARRAYKRQWNRNNPDKVRAHQQRYWEKKAQEYRESLQNPANICKEGDG